MPLKIREACSRIALKKYGIGYGHAACFHLGEADRDDKRKAAETPSCMQAGGIKGIGTQLDSRDVTMIAQYFLPTNAIAFNAARSASLRSVSDRRMWPLCALAALCLAFAGPATAQTTEGSSSNQRVLDLLGAGEAPSIDAPRLPGYTSPTRGEDEVVYDLRQRPSAPPQLNLSTTVETTVENRTSHQVSGSDGGRAADPAPPRPSPPKPDGGRASVEFRDIVSQSVGRPLPVFGESVFRDHSGIASSDPLTVPADYRIGPGDELLIRAWGQISIDFQGEVSRAGSVFLPGIGEIMVSGMRLSESRDLIRGVIATQYRDFDVTVSLASLRDIQIYMSGFVDAPGVHVVPSTATALSGLLASGGPGDGADLRRIQVKRGGQVVAHFDAYDFLLAGDKSADPQLLPGDTIYVPAAQGYVAIAGSVRREAIYHFAQGMTLDDLLALAGGSTVAASAREVRLERQSAGEREVQVLDSDTARRTLPLRDGDLVMIVPASPRFEASITVTGHVAFPLRRSWREGMTVSDVLPSADALVPHAKVSQRNGRVSLEDVAAAPGRAAQPSLTPEVNWDHAAIERLDPRTQTVSLIAFDLGAALADPHGKADPALMPGDTILIYARDAFEQPAHKRTRLVRIQGEVAVPGVYSMPLGATLHDLIQRAGGSTSEAYLYGTSLSRASARRNEAERIRKTVDLVEEDYFRFLATRSRDLLGEQEARVAATELQATEALIGRLRKFEPVGRVVFGLNAPVAQAESLPALRLEDGDIVTIPGKTDTITVIGSVFQTGTLLWREGDDAHDYIARAGGLRPQADRRGIMIVHADGTVRPLRGHRGDVYPGDSIVIPEDVDRSTLGRRVRQWTTTLYQLAISAAALKAITD